MAGVLMNTTLPTIIGAGVVSRATETMFGRGKRTSGRAGSRSRVRTTRQKTVAIVGIATTRTGANKRATGYRNTLKKHGLPYIGKIRVMKTGGGFVVTYTK